MLELKDFEAAADRLKNVIHNIPLSTSATFSAMTGAEVYLKYENQQKTGSFKVRGAYNKIMKRTSREAPRKTSSSLEVGQSVKVVSGVFVDFEGVVAEVSPESGKVKVMVSIFGRETPVELTFNEVAKI